MADQLLPLMSQVACRPTCVDRGAGTAAAVESGRTLLDFYKPKSATDGAKKSPALMDSSSGRSASGYAEVVATGVVSRSEGGAGAGRDADMVVTGFVSKGEGGAGAGSFADVLATGVVNGLEDCEGVGIDMDGVFSDAADRSGVADRTLVHAPIYCAGLRPAVREPVLQHYPLTLHGYWQPRGVSWEARINLNRVSLHVLLTASRGILSPGSAGTVARPGGTCAPCLDIKDTKGYRVSCPSAALAHHWLFDYIDRLTLTQGFEILNNSKYSLTSLALTMMACLPSLFVNARACGKPSTGAQARNEPPSKETK